MGRKNTMSLVVDTIESVSNSVLRFAFIDESKTLTPADESGYVKLQFTEGDGSQKRRSYTIRSVDDNHRVVIDFVKHHGGVAYPWAMRANIGDVLPAFGPGPAKLVDFSADWFILMGDLTALPAIAVNLARLPADANGYAIIEVRDDSDIQTLSKPAGVHIEWLVNIKPQDSAELMLTAAKRQPWHSGTPYVWVASEFSSARALREYFKNEKHIKTNRYFSSYWKIGESDEGNKHAKAQDGGF